MRPDPAQMTDDALMAAIAADDERAFREVVARHGAALRGYALRWLGGAMQAQADDLVQEVFIRALQAAPRWQAQGIKFSTWAYRVMSRLVIDAARRHKHHATLALDQVMEPMDESEDAQTQLINQQRLAALHQAIATLPERQRQVMMLTYGSGLPNSEVAQVLGISIEAVEAALSRGRAALKTQMQLAGYLEIKA